MVNFRVQSGKFTPGRKIYTDGVSRVTDNYQVCDFAWIASTPSGGADNDIRYACSAANITDYHRLPLTGLKNYE